MADNEKSPDTKSTSSETMVHDVGKGKSPQDETLEKLTGASPHSENEAEGEGDGALDEN